jgi:dTDP-4-amino-4,6-dideoxygalactose transaminase
VAQRVRLLRDHGRSTKNSHLLVGFNARLDRLNDEVLAMKLKYLDQWNAQRREHAARYDSMFSRCPGLVTVKLDPGVISARHQYVVTCPARDRLRKYLSGRGVATGVHYPSLITEQEPVRKLGFSSAQTPVAAKLNGELLSLPCFPELESNELDYVIEHVLSFFDEEALCP